MKNKIAIVILNWNGLKDTIDCVNSILKTSYKSLQIYCLDNGSKNKDYLILKNKFKNNNFKLFKSNKNLGFAKGNNYVVSKINLDKFDYVFLLNNDTILKKDFFKKFNKSKSLKNKNIGIFVPTIYRYNKKLNMNKLWKIGDIKKVLKMDKEIKRPSGCALLIRSKIIKKEGLFDEEFFAYCEENEFTYRIRKKGIKIYYLPKIILWHKIIEHKDSLFKIYMVSRNKWRFFKKKKLVDKFFYLPYLLFFYNLKRLFIYFNNLQSIKVFFKGNIDGIKWILVNKKPKNPFIENE